MNTIFTQIDELLDKLLRGDLEWLSEEGLSALLENRERVVQHLNTVFLSEGSRLLKGEECLPTLFWGFKLAGFLGISEAFPWLQKLCHLSIEALERSLGDDFVTEELAYLLTDTMSQWSALKTEIENPVLNEYVRSACLDALIFSVAKGQVACGEVVTYFKSLFHRILNGELDDELFCTHLVSSCTDFWPGECLEEIREVFGLNLVDETFLAIDFVLEAFLKGRDNCIGKLQISQ